MALFLDLTMFALFDNRGPVTKETIGPQSVPVVFTTLSFKKKIALKMVLYVAWCKHYSFIACIVISRNLVFLMLRQLLL